MANQVRRLFAPDGLPLSFGLAYRFTREQLAEIRDEPCSWGSPVIYGEWSTKHLNLTRSLADDPSFFARGQGPMRK